MIKNPYEHLKTPCLEDVTAVEPQSSMSVTDSREESIVINTAMLPSGSWVYGYSVYWKNGKHSYCRPTAEHGLFKTEREAQLYAVGFMGMYLSYFTEETRAAIRKSEYRLSQSELF